MNVESETKMDTREEMRQFVKAGAKYCDREYSGWAKVIDVDGLDMSNPYYCVGGQLEGSYFEFTTKADKLDRYDDRYDWALRHGFTDDMDRFDILRDRWIEEIEARVKTN